MYSSSRRPDCGMAPTVTGSFRCDEPIDTSVRCAPGEVAMLTRNTTDRTPAPITATVVLGQFLKVRNMMLSIRLTERLALRPTSLPRSSKTSVPCVVSRVRMTPYELAHTEGFLLGRATPADGVEPVSRRGLNADVATPNDAEPPI